MSNTMQMLANRAVRLMLDRIDSGKDLDGKAFKYSTRPFVRPAGGLLKKVLNKLDKAPGESRYFRRAGTGGLWVKFLGGYAEFREFSDRSASGDFLTYTGKMLNSLKVLSVDKESFVLGFNDKKSAEIAFYQNVSGVGKSRRLWRWFGLNNSDLTNLSKLIEESV